MESVTVGNTSSNESFCCSSQTDNFHQATKWHSYRGIQIENEIKHIETTLLTIILVLLNTYFYTISVKKYQSYVYHDWLEWSAVWMSKFRLLQEACTIYQKQIGDSKFLSVPTSMVYWLRPVTLHIRSGSNPLVCDYMIIEVSLPLCEIMHSPNVPRNTLMVIAQFANRYSDISIFMVLNGKTYLEQILCELSN